MADDTILSIGRSSVAGGADCVKVRAIIALLEADGWRLVTTRGDHRQYKHPVKPGRVTVPGHMNDDLAPKTRDSVLKQAGLPKPGKK